MNETMLIQHVPQSMCDFTEQHMIRNGKDRLRKTLWLRSQARAIGSALTTQPTLHPDVQELWFADFAPRSDFERLLLERANEQPAH
jgi:hypothetical protein